MEFNHKSLIEIKADLTAFFEMQTVFHETTRAVLKKNDGSDLEEKTYKRLKFVVSDIKSSDKFTNQKNTTYEVAKPNINIDDEIPF